MNRLRLPLILLLGVLLYLPASTSTVASKKPALVSFCSNLATPNTPIQGHASNLTFACPTNPAFTARQATTSTPTFTLPTGYSALFLMGNSITRLTSNTPISLQPGDYQYLAQYDGSSLGTLQTFTITWSG